MVIGRQGGRNIETQRHGDTGTQRHMITGTQGREGDREPRDREKRSRRIE